MSTQQIRVSVLSNRASTLLQYLVAVFFALIVLVPLVATVINGFKSPADLLADPFGLPRAWQWENYTSIIRGEAFWRQLKNSTMVVLVVALSVVVLASMPAFIFARMSFRGRDLLFQFFTLGLLLPITVLLLPLYITLRQANLVDSLWGVILPQIAFQLPSTILILRGFFAGIPRELEEAAAMDGCTSAGFFVRVLLPIMRPAIAAVVVLTMVASWNDFFLPLLVLNKEQLWTLPLGIMQFQGQFGTDWGRVLAFVALSLIPTIIFYLLAERQIVAGLTAGAVKG